MGLIRSLPNSKPIRWAQSHPLSVGVCMVILYRLCLDVFYWLGLSRMLAYEGITASWNPTSAICSLLALIAFAPLVARTNRQTTPSSIIVTLISYIYFIPLTSYYGCKGTVSAQFFVIALVFWGLLMLWQHTIPVLTLKPASPKYVRAAMIAITLLSCAFVMYISGRYTHFRLTLDFINVYDIRAESTTYPISTLSSYILSMMPIVLSISLLYWLRAKRYIVALLVTTVYLFLFSIHAFKSTFFFLVLTLAGYYLFRNWMYSWLPGIAAGGTLLSVFLSKINNLSYFVNLLFHRGMYLPVHFSEYYMQFFQNNPLNLSREGIMGKLSFSAVYPIPVAKVAGESFGHYGEYANNGLLGDLFANFPTILGLILLPLILILCFRLLDMTALRLPVNFIIPLCLYNLIGFINSPWSVNVLSRGFLLTCVLLFFFGEEGCTHEKL